jgi:hypothetical protein
MIRLMQYLILQNQNFVIQFKDIISKTNSDSIMINFLYSNTKKIRQRKSFSS